MADNEAIVRAFLAAWSERDARKLADFFSEDTVVWNDARNTVRGREALHEHFGAHLSVITDCDIEVTQTAVSGNFVFTERVDRLTIAGAPITLPVTGVFEVNDAGEITAWRDYFDLSDVMRQLEAAGVPTDGTATPPA